MEKFLAMRWKFGQKKWFLHYIYGAVSVKSNPVGGVELVWVYDSGVAHRDMITIPYGAKRIEGLSGVSSAIY